MQIKSLSEGRGLWTNKLNVIIKCTNQSSESENGEIMKDWLKQSHSVNFQLPEHFNSMQSLMETRTFREPLVHKHSIFCIFFSL